MNNTLKTSSVIGFFSLPSPSLAEHNPTAYCTAMASLPTGAGTCSHCGTGIRHHVVIRDEKGVTRFIGTSCAEKVGVDSESLRYKMTTEQLEARKAERAVLNAEWQRKQQEQEDARLALIASRRERVGHLIDMLRNLGGDFFTSLASQLEVRPLSWRQAEYVAKATSATGRRNKKNAESFDTVLEECTI
jgi:hypothetical protein